MAAAPSTAPPAARLRFRLDPGRAIIALGLACALWIVAQNEANPERTDIPALVDGTLPQHRVTKLSPRPADREALTMLFRDAMRYW